MNSWLRWNWCVIGYIAARFPNWPRCFKSQSKYVFFSWTVASWVGKVPSRARLLILQRRVGRVETQTVKLVSEVCLVVILWRQKRHQMGLGPHWRSDSDIYIQTLSPWDGDVKICKVAFEDNIADPLTKCLARVLHEHHVMSMEIRHINGCS